MPILALFAATMSAVVLTAGFSVKFTYPRPIALF